MKHRHHRKHIEHIKRHKKFIKEYNRKNNVCKVIKLKQLNRSLEEENKFKIFFYALCKCIMTKKDKNTIFIILNNTYQNTDLSFTSAQNDIKENIHNDIIYNKNVISVHKFVSNKQLRKYVKSIIILLLSTYGKSILNKLDIDDEHIKIINKYTLKIFRKTSHFIYMLYYFLNK